MANLDQTLDSHASAADESVPPAGLSSGTTGTSMVENLPTERESLVALLKRAQGGDQIALEEFLLRLQPPAIAFLRRRLREPRLESFVEDVLAEVLMRVYRHHDKCQADSERGVIAWVLSIARNEALRLLEKRPLRYGILLGDRDPAELSGRRNGKVLPPLGGTFHASHGTSHRSEGLKALLRVLEDVEDQADPDLSTLLYLKLVEDRAWQEIGDEFGISSSAAKRRFQRAQASLGKQMMRGINKLPTSERAAALEFLGQLDEQDR